MKFMMLSLIIEVKKKKLKQKVYPKIFFVNVFVFHFLLLESWQTCSKEVEGREEGRRIDLKTSKMMIKPL